MNPRYEVNCHLCGWNHQCVDFNDIKSWYKKLCPQCHKTEIVNKKEYRLLKWLNFSIKISRLLDPYKKYSIPVRIQSNPIREGKPPKITISEDSTNERN